MKLLYLENLKLLNLSSNGLFGEIPAHIGCLTSLENLSLGDNLISGSIPESMSEILGLVHVDLSLNRLEGTILAFFNEMKNLKYLNLENNFFHGILPFNESFLKQLAAFKFGNDSNLCYNRTITLSKVELGIAPCDKHGLPPYRPPPDESPVADDGSIRVVLDFAMALSFIALLIAGSPI